MIYSKSYLRIDFLSKSHIDLHSVSLSLRMADVDRWEEVVKTCSYLPETELKVNHAGP